MGSLLRNSVWKPFITLWALWATLCPVFGKEFPSELVQIIGVKEGLSQSTVYDIVQDKDGYIWSATGEGLNRFDGYQFQTFYKDIRNPNGLKANMIRGLLADKDGGLWIGTDKSIYFKKHQSEHFKEYRINPKVDHLIYVPLMRQDHFLFGTIQAHGIFRLNLNTNEFKIYPYPHFPGSKIIPDRDGNLWFTDTNKILVRFTALHDQPTFTKIARQVFCIGTDQHKNVYALMPNGVFSIHKTDRNQRFTAILKGVINPEMVELMYRTASGIWFHQINGSTSFFHLTKKEWQPFMTPTVKGRDSHGIYTILEDKSSNIWMASNEKGMILVSPSKLKFEKIQTLIRNQPATDFIKCFAEDADGRILVGTHEEGFLEFSPDLKVYNRIKLNPESAEDPPIFQFYSSNRKDFWIATQLGLYLFNRKTGIKTIEAQHFYTGFSTLGRDVFVRRNGYLIPLEEVTKTISTQMFSYPKNIRFTTDLGNHRLFAAHRQYGASIIQLDKSLKFNVLQKFENLRIFSLFRAGINRYYLTSDIGIIVTDTNFQMIPTHSLPEDIPQRHIYGLLADRKGNLWGGTNKGLLHIHEAQNRAVIYTSENGLQSMEFNSEAFFQDRNGRMYFGGINGFNYFQPDLLSENRNTVPVYISEIKINQESIPYADIPQIKLPGKKHDLQLTFSTPEFTYPDKTELLIKIIGTHPNWVNLKNRRTFYQSGMEPGLYTVLAKTRNSDGFESEEKKMLQIEIDLPFLRKPINIAMLFIIGLLIVSGTLRRRQQLKIAKLQSERELEIIRKNIYRDLHDELGAGLSRIKIIADVALMDEKRKENSLFKQVSDAAAEVTGKLREIVWAMNPRNENLRGVLLRLQASTEEMLKYLPLHYEFQMPEKIPELALLPGTIRNLLLVHKEVMHNIQKYSQADKVNVSVQIEGTWLKIKIQDNGIGFDPKEAMYKGNGLRIMEDRVKESGGQFNLISEKGKGTCIELVLILKPVHNLPS